MRSHIEPKHTKNNSLKLDNAQISLDFLQKEVRKLNEEQKAIRLMLLEILENTRPYVLQEKESEPEPPEPEPESWRWWG